MFTPIICVTGNPFDPGKKEPIMHFQELDATLPKAALDLAESAGAFGESVILTNQTACCRKYKKADA